MKRLLFPSALLLALLSFGLPALAQTADPAASGATLTVKPLTPAAFSSLIGIYVAESNTGLYAQVELTKEQCMPLVLLERRANVGDIALQERYQVVNFDPATLNFALVRSDSPHGLTASMSPEQPNDVLIIVDQSEAGTFIQRFIRQEKAE